MECENCLDDMTAYMDRELSARRTQEIKSHLEACPGCRDEYSALVESATLIDSHAGVAQLRPEVWQNVRARISAMEAPVPGRGFLGFLELHRWTAAAAMLLVVAAVALGVWSYLRYEQSQKELQDYMNAYIQQRGAQDAGSTASVLKARDSQGPAVPRIYGNNPFVQADETEPINLFRTEEIAR
jgi:anti-sigma factor RsiW